MTWLLPRTVGLGRAMYLTLTADDVRRPRAMGSVADTTPDGTRVGPTIAVVADITQ